MSAHLDDTESDFDDTDEGVADGASAPVNPDFDISLLTEAERAALGDDLSMPDTLDVEEEAGDGTPDLTAAARAAAAPAAPITATLPPDVMNIDFDAKQAEIDEKIEDLNRQLADGEIGEDDFSEAVKAAAKEAGKLEILREQVEQARRAIIEADNKAWNAAVSAFKERHPHLWDPAVVGEFDRYVALVTKPDSPWANLPFEKQLEKAAQDYAFAKGDPRLAAPSTPRPAPKPRAESAPKPAAPRRSPPPATLARIPAAADNSATLSAFADLDNAQSRGDLRTVERAFARMSEEQRDKYLRGG
jgi:hypothetical protein